ncbi:hypothetical protein D9758_003633 [Tetrapyrgos nigripes]|uniref:Phosphoinositide phospholipase C n=1 Tax=Tetrapyrgos nigripes TaxID=182062 RepID=A0A8H5GLW0_9AGAR|nr:hypothetical protein D9758_003633 [Tetrapyrgos nigripes]
MSLFDCFTPPRPPLVHFASKTTELGVLSSEDAESKQKKTASLGHLVKTKCPSLFQPFVPVWWMRSGHVQTIYAVFKDLSQVDPMRYRRQLLELVDGGTLGLDFAPVDDSTLQDETPIVVVQHGLTGGLSLSKLAFYFLTIVARVVEPPERGGLGYRAIVVHFRGCGGVPMTSPRFYSAGGTDDIRQALVYISHKYPKAPLLGVSFSLGANIMTRYVAEEGEKCRLSAACTLACPWDLDANDRLMTSSWTGQRIYGPALGGNLVALIKRHHKVMALSDPTHPVAKAIPPLLAIKDITLHKYDETFARVAAGPPPLFPLPSAEAYYKAMSSHYAIKDIKIPYLAVNAADDPVVRHVPMDGGENPNVVMVLTGLGGHLGWFVDGAGRERWTTKPVLEWLRLHGEVAAKGDSKPGKVWVDEEGYLRDEAFGMEFGCREKYGGGVISGNGGEDEVGGGDGDVKVQMVEGSAELESTSSNPALRRNSTGFWKPKLRRLSEQLLPPPNFASGSTTVEADGSQSLRSMTLPSRSSSFDLVTTKAPRRALKRARNLLTTSGKPLDDVRDIVPSLDEVNVGDGTEGKSGGLLQRHSINLRKSIKRSFKGVSRSFKRTRSVPDTGEIIEQIYVDPPRGSFSFPSSTLPTRIRHGRSYSEVIDRQHPLIELTPPLSAVPASPVDLNEQSEPATSTDMPPHASSAPLLSTPSSSSESSSKAQNNQVIIPEILQIGTVLEKVSSKKPSKHTKLVFRLDAGRGMIVWETAAEEDKDVKTKFIPVENIREIRTGPTALMHLTQYGMNPPAKYIDRWMTLIYAVSASAARSSMLPLSLPVQISASSKYAYSGQSFKTLHLLAPSAEEKHMWEDALKGLQRVWVGLTGGSGSFGGGLNRDRGMEEMRKGLWERMYWDGIQDGSLSRRKSWGGGSGSAGGENDKMTFEFAERLCRRLNVGLGVEDMKRLFDQADTQHRRYLSFEDFQRFVKLLKARPDVNRLYKKLLRECRRPEQDHSKKLFTFDVFEYFMREKQKCVLPVSELQIIFGRYSEEIQDPNEHDMLLNSPSVRPLPLPIQPPSLLSPPSPKSSSTLPTPPPSSFSTPVMPITDLEPEAVMGKSTEQISSPDQPNSESSPPRVMSPESFASFLLSSDNPTLLETRTGKAQGTGSAIEAHGESHHHHRFPNLGHFLHGHAQDKLDNPSTETCTVAAIKNAVTGKSPEASNGTSSTSYPQPLSEISHDMTRPLSEYYISSSHNTYLLGHQLVGSSTTEGYIRALLSGCRSVELDIYDSDSGPRIFHGKTLTTKVSLREVCEAIAKFGFVASEYPIIISAEVHCGHVGQGMIADIMKEVFKWRLVRKEKGVIVGLDNTRPAPIESDGNDEQDEDNLVDSLLKDWRVEELPSPEALKGRILLKTKNLFLAARKDQNTQLVASPSTSPDGFNSPGPLTLVDTSTSSTSDTEAIRRKATYRQSPSQRDSDTVVADITQDFRRTRSVMQRVRSIGSAHKTPPSTPNKASHASRSKSPADQKHKYKMNPSLVRLLVYTVGVKSRGINKKEEYAANEMFSLSENAANKMLKVGMIDLIKHTRGHLVRIYPKGTRVSSTNYHPHRYWSGGAQLVAINWQTFDAGYMINHSMFQRNGRCGYVLKPLPLRDPHKETLTKREERVLDVTIISAQQLPLPRDEDGKEIVGKSDFDPYVEVTLHIPDWPSPPPTALSPNSIASGLMRASEAASALANSGPDGNSKTSPMPSLSTHEISYRTNSVKNNRFSPMWEEKLRIPFTCVEGMEELVFVTFAIRQDKEDEEPLAMFCASLGCLQPGYRHLPLHDAQMAQFLFSTLFVKIGLT